MLARDYPDQPGMLARAKRAGAWARFHQARQVEQGLVEGAGLAGHLLQADQHNFLEGLWRQLEYRELKQAPGDNPGRFTPVSEPKPVPCQRTRAPDAANRGGFPTGGSRHQR